MVLGCCRSGGGSDEATGAESFCSDLVGELFASIIVHVGYKQVLISLSLSDFFLILKSA